MYSYRISFFVFICGGALMGCPESSPSSGAAQTTKTQAEALGSEGGPGEHEGRRPHAPPPEAYAACASVAVGAACTLKMGDKEIQGKCVAAAPGEADTRSSCRPEGGPHGGGHRGPGAPN
jgi:hypothetical protein